MTVYQLCQQNITETNTNKLRAIDHDSFAKYKELWIGQKVKGQKASNRAANCLFFLEHKVLGTE